MDELSVLCLRIIEQADMFADALSALSEDELEELAASLEELLELMVRLSKQDGIDGRECVIQGAPALWNIACIGPMSKLLLPKPVSGLKDMIGKPSDYVSTEAFCRAVGIIMQHYVAFDASRSLGAEPGVPEGKDEPGSREASGEELA